MYKTVNEERIELLEKFILLVVGVFVLLIIGMLVFHFSEGWSYKESLYFAGVSLTSRGVTPNYPTTWFAVLFSVVYMVVGVAFIIYSFSNLIGYYVSYYDKHMGQKVHEIFEWFKGKKKEKQKTNKWVHIK